MRVVKEASERRNEILDVAQELFAAKGYDATSTGDILDKIGIARGTLYYHFKSKEDILDAMIERINKELIAKASIEAGKKDIPVVDRIVDTIKCLKLQTEAGSEVLEQVHKPQNALMHQKMQQNLLDCVVPVISNLIKEGITQGVFDTRFPDEATEMLMLYSMIAFDDLTEQSSEKLMTRTEAFIYNTEKILGAESGSMKQSMMKLFV